MIVRRRRTTKWYVALAAMAALMVASVGLAQFSSQASTLQIQQGTVVVTGFEMRVMQGNLLVAGAIVETANGPAQGARVSFKGTLPDGNTYTVEGETNSQGHAILSNPLPGDGTYKAEIVDVRLNGYRFDASNSQTTATLTVGNGGNEPAPQPTEPAPQPTEPAPQPTEPGGGHPGEPQGPYGQWHPPTTHEHGDPPPAWVDQWIKQQAAAGVPGFSSEGLIFGGDEQTPNEYTMKEIAFKGFTARFHGVDIYWRYHAQSNPMGQDARFHSYEIYARDPSGNVSFWQGWMDFGVGNNTLPTVRDGGCEDDTMRPIMGVNKLGCGDYTFESWYSKPGNTGPGGGWTWDTGLNMQATFYHDGDPHNMESWTPAPDNNKGLTRRVEMAWYADRSGDAPRDQWFWATQFGTIVSGPDDPACGTTRTFGERSYEVKCLPQYISSTMPSVTFPGNSSQKTFSCPECRLPN